MTSISSKPMTFDHMKCTDCPIRLRAVCSRCEKDELEALEAIKTYRTYEAGETIVWAGEPMKSVGSVVSGTATISRTLEDGRRQMLGLLLPSDFVGRPGRDIAIYDVTAVRDTVICQFDRKQFEALIERSPKISQRFLEMTLDELAAAREWMLILGRKTAREKVASFFAILARKEAALNQVPPEADLVRFTLPITRETMADYLGLTLETISRQITALRKDGVIEMASMRQVVVPDFERLTGEANEDPVLPE